MNRIHPESTFLDPMLNASVTGSGDSARGSIVPASGAYALFAPLHYEPHYAYPLMVWLHGQGHDEQQLRRIMPSVSLRNYVAVAPRGTTVAPSAKCQEATKRHDATADSPSGASPGAKPAETAATSGFSWRQTEGHIQAAEVRVMECVAAAAEKFNVASDRCFLAGYGSGGTMAFRIALRNPQTFAGVLSLCGPFPSSRSPLAQLHHVRRLEVFIACCRSGSLYPTDAVCDDLRLLHTAGMSVVLREYPGDDMLTPQMLADMDRWLMEQVIQVGSEAKGFN